MNGWDLALLVLLVLAIGLAVRRIRRDRRQGKTCCGDCAACVGGCPSRGEGRG